MKCASCGKEFGNGTNCQYCGVDRVTGLGNYSGYSPAKNIPQSATYTESHSNTYQEPSPVEDKNIICYNCGGIIPKDSKFCPYCSTNLYVTCPKCGKEYSSQFPACSECGTNRDEYYKKQREKEEEERLYKKWEEIIEKDPSGKEYEKIKDDNNVSWLERYVAEKAVKIKKFSEKWEKIFEQDPSGKEYEKIRHDYTTSWEEREAAEKVNIKTIGRRNEILFDKWINILRKDPNENEYNKLLNNKDASWIEKDVAKRAKRTIIIENRKSRDEKFKTISKVIPYDWWKILFRSMIGVTTVFFIIWFFMFCVKSPSDIPYGFRIIQLAVATMLSFAACCGVQFIIYGIIRLSGFDDYISKKRGIKKLKLFIQEHPDDIDIDFLRKKLSEMTS